MRHLQEPDRKRSSDPRPALRAFEGSLDWSGIGGRRVVHHAAACLKAIGPRQASVERRRTGMERRADEGGQDRVHAVVLIQTRRTAYVREATSTDRRKTLR